MNNPYVGLRPFGREDYQIFFGRDEHIDVLLEKLQRLRFVAVFGPSGFGKSSLVRAGLLPALAAGLGISSRWKIAEMRPGNRPFLRMARALCADEVLDFTTHRFLATLPPGGAENYVRPALKRGPLGLKELLDECLLPAKANLLLLVDQFEELFRYRQQEPEHENTAAFVNLLLTSVQQTEHPVYVVITMRSDFLGDCTAFLGLPEAINEGQFLTPRLTRMQLAEAIKGPARLYNGQVEKALVERLLDDASRHPDQLPLIQHVLQRLWSETQTDDARWLSLERYQALGGFGEILSRHIDEAYLGLSPAQRKLGEKVFRLLCERGDDRRDTRRPTQFRELRAITGASRKGLLTVLKPFRTPERSFVTPPLPKPLDEETVIDISHESLIRQWKRLGGWVEAEERSAAMHRRVLETAVRWGQGEAGLWRSPDLDFALQWWEVEQPNAVWMARYGGQFDLVKRFLDESQATELAANEEAERLRAMELRAAQEAEMRRSLDLFESRLTHASLLVKGEDFAQAEKVLEESRDLDDKVAASRRHARDLLARCVAMVGCGPQQTYERAGAALFDVAVSPDGRWLAAAGENGTLVLFNPENGDLIQRLEGHSGDVKGVVVHPQNRWLASAGDDGRIIRWSLPQTGHRAEQEQSWSVSSPIWALAISPDGELLASGGIDGVIHLWRAGSGEELRKLEGHRRAIATRGLAFSPSGELLASASYDDTARLWQVETGESQGLLQGYSGDFNGVVFSPDGTRIATSHDGPLVLWSFESGQLSRSLQVFTGHQNFVLGLGLIARPERADSRDETTASSSQLLISASLDRTLRIWDIDSGTVLRVLQGHSAGVLGLAVQADKASTGSIQVFSAANDGVVMRWDLAPLPFQRLVDLPESAFSTAISPNGDRVAVGFESGALRVYSLPTMHLLAEQDDAHAQAIKRLCFDSDGARLASASLDDTAKLWEITPTGTLLAQQIFNGYANGVHDIVFSPDGKLLATAGHNGYMGIFSTDGGESRFFQTHGGRVLSVAFSADGDGLLVGHCDEHKARLWDLHTDPPTPVREFPEILDQLMWAAFSPDEHSVAVVGRNSFVGVYSIQDAELQHRLIGHEQTVLRAIFSPDSRQLATVSADATLRLWDLDTGGELFALRLPTHRSPPAPLWDFDFRCTSTGCWIAVPLTRGKLALYEFGGIYE